MPYPPHNLTHAGRTQSIAAWSRETRIPEATIRSRIFRFKWPVDRALTTPPNRKLARGGRKKSGSVRACPEMKEHADGRAYCRWSEKGQAKWRTFGKWGSNEAKLEYRRFALDWANRQGGEVNAPGGRAEPKIGDLISAWLAHCERTYRKYGKPTSELYCNRAAHLPLAELFGDEPAREFTAPKLRTVREAMIDREWVRPTINAHVKRIIRAFAWAATELMVPAAVHTAIALVEPIAAGRRDEVEEGEGVDPAPREDVDAVLVGAHLHRDPGRRAVLAALIQVQLLGNMRPGEACSLAADQIDRRKAPWRCVVTDFNKMLHRNTTRVVFFGPQARAILAPLIEEHPSGPIFVLPPAHKSASPTPVTPQRYRYYVQQACESAGVTYWAPNQLRHTRATELMDTYESDQATAAALGNSPEVARQVYADRAGESVARRIAEATG